MGYRHTISPSLYGDGSDGDLIIESAMLAARPVYQFRSLTIAAGASFALGSMGTIRAAALVIRCQSPIRLEGTIRASGAGALPQGSSWTDNGGSFMSSPTGMQAVGAASVYPIPGGANGYFTASVPSVPGYTSTGLQGPGDGIKAPEWLRTVRAIVGPDGLYRLAAGMGGAMDNGGNYFGGNGAGALILIAPAILFGDGAAIEARGNDATGIGADSNAGGGGGGYIEIHTAVPLSPADEARLDVSGGRGGTEQAGVANNGASGFHNLFRL